MINKGNNDLDDFKYLIDSRNLTNKEKVLEREAILKARASRFRNRSDNEIKNAKLMQLKYQIKDYIDNLIENHTPSFLRFLKVYIDTLYNKRKEFASDINIEPISLSHILNGHREPNERFLSKLIRHSHISFKELGGFDKQLWPRIYFWDKAIRYLNSIDDWDLESEKSGSKKSTGKFIIKKNKSGQFRFELIARNGQVILSSEAYKTRASCASGIASVRKNSVDESKYEKKTAKDGSPYFNLKAANGQVIGSSEMYSNNSGMENGIASVKRNASKAKIKVNV